MAFASVVMFVVAMTIFGPLGTLEALEPLPRLGYWGVSAAITFPLCYAVAAMALYLTRRRSLVEIVPAVAVAVLVEGCLCTAVIVAIDLFFVPHVELADLVNTYMTVTVVVAVCTFFAHYVVFLRISHERAAVAYRPAPGAAPPAGGRAAATAGESASRPAPASAPGRGRHGRTATDGAGGRDAVPPDRALHDADGGPGPGPAAARARSGKLTTQQARFCERLPDTVSRDIVYLKMDDHYINVHTTGGSCLVLMRLADAIAELGTLGMQVHRSYWVAHSHMRAVARRDGRPMVRVSGGHQVPISRPYVAAVRAALYAKATEGGATGELHDT